MSFSNPTFPGWTNAKCELPDAENDCLGVVTARHGRANLDEIDVVFYDGVASWLLCENLECVTVSHWMPLPATPKQLVAEIAIIKAQHNAFPKGRW